MTVRTGREFLAVPGPTTIPDEVLQAMHRPAVELYSPPLVELTDTLLRDLRRLFGTAGHAYIYIANGHGAWEAALTNVLSKGDKILVLASGRFGIDWGDAAARLGVEVEVLGGDWRRAVQPADVERRLRDDKGGAIKAILAVQIETSTGIVNDIAAIGQAIKTAGHEALFMVDTVASLGCVPFTMDAWGVDVAVSASQKGLMSPPGLGFAAANDRARAVHRKAGLRTPYWDWTAREADTHYRKYAGTPPEHLIYALRKALDMLFEEGLENAFLRHRLLAEAVRRAVAAVADRQGDRIQRHQTRRAVRYRDNRTSRWLSTRSTSARLLRDQMRRRARPRHRTPGRQSVSHRPHGLRQRPDGARHTCSCRDGTWRARYSARQRRRAGSSRVAERERKTGIGVSAQQAYSILMSAALTTLSHFAVSLRMRAVKRSCGNAITVSC